MIADSCDKTGRGTQGFAFRFERTQTAATQNVALLWHPAENRSAKGPAVPLQYEHRLLTTYAANMARRFG